MDDLDALARLTAKIESLEQRVSSLEHPSKTATTIFAHPVSPDASRSSSEEVQFAEAGGVFPVLGKAMLGIAGAYLLRAVAESGSFPKLVVVALALAYAGAWLAWAARVPPRTQFASTAYATTSTLILVPMLWELTLRFGVLSSSATASVLCGFVLFAYSLAWKRSLTSVVWVANVAAVLTALALLIATRDLVPFVSVLLFIALASEVAAGRNRWLRLRPVVAVAVDLAIWILLYIYARPEGTPSEYKNVAMPVLLALACSLFLIYGASIIFRAMRLRLRISAFEIGQSILAFLLAAFSTLRFGASAGPPILGAVCLLFSAAGYSVAFACLDQSLQQRNFHVCATWSAALFLTGLSICLPTLPLALCLSAGAILATLAGGWSHRQTLEFHGLAYLAAAAYASGLLNYMGRALMGTFPAAPGWIVWMAAASTVACYIIEARFRTGLGIQRILRLAFAVLAAPAVITFAVSVLRWLAALGATVDASQVAVIRTLIACLVALALAFGGSRWHLSELIWVAYATLALVTTKLLLEDLRDGSPGSRAVSIFLYAVTLILVPRMASIEHRGRAN